MPYRRVLLINNKIYHIINRSIARFCIYNNTNDYQRFIDLINFYQYTNLPMKYSRFNKMDSKEKKQRIKKIQMNKKIIKIFSFCLMPNHFHLLIKQNLDNGISTFMRLIQDSYAKYFNIKYKRKGPLFESSFKAIRVENDEQLVHVSRYIHLNPVSSSLININQINQYPWSSYKEYYGQRKNNFIDKPVILNYFQNKNEYIKFVKNHADYQKELQNIKKLILE